MLASSPASTRATRSRVFVLATSTMVILAARCNGCSGPTADPRLRSVVFALRAHNEDQAPNGIVCALGPDRFSASDVLPLPDVRYGSNTHSPSGFRPQRAADRKGVRVGDERVSTFRSRWAP